MRKIRLVFVLLALVLFLPMVLLVRSALLNADYEREARHRALAERASDEMERELSQLLEDEEARPFGHYRYYFVPPNSAGGRYAVTRSPLAEEPEHPFVLGYFQIEPDGSIVTPLAPADPEVALARGDWSASPELERKIDDIRRIVGVVISGPNAIGSSGGSAKGLSQDPGTTKRMQARPASEELQEAAFADDGAAPPSDAFSALKALNRGAKRGGPPIQLDLRFAPLDDGSGFKITALMNGRSEPIAQSELRLSEASSRPDLYLDPESALADQTPIGQTVYLHRMSGRLIGSEHLLLMRAAAVEGDWYWQGAVLHLGELSRSLDETVFGDRRIARLVRRDFVVQGGPNPPELRSASFTYLHRFARPFSDLGVRFAVSPMSDLGSSYISVLGLLVLVAGSGGLYALYRMVGVTVGFAERRSNFAAAVSHELKTPVTAIRMYAEMLRDGMADSEEKRREYAATIGAESERLSRLINNVLEFSRLEQGTRDVELVVGKLPPVVEEAARILEPHARQAGFELQVEVEEGLPEVRFDRDAMLQVVFNLVDNALKYARDASDRTIVLRCARVEGGAMLCVRDRGPGVPSQHLGRIFEAFYRGEDELIRTTKGTGIGLALVSGLAQRMGAAVSGANASDGGFEVAVRFPAAA